MDNILIAACTIEELTQRTKTVLDILEKEDLFLKPEKCDFEKRTSGIFGIYHQPQQDHYGSEETIRNIRLAQSEEPSTGTIVPRIRKFLSTIHRTILVCTRYYC